MQLSYTTRIQASVLILVLACTASVLLALSRTHVTEAPKPGRTELYGRRLAPLRQVLPTEGVVGYINPDDTIRWGLRRTRYFLAPVRIDTSANHEIVIGNFDGRSVTPEWLASRGLIVKQDFGQGVMLLERARR